MRILRAAAVRALEILAAFTVLVVIDAVGLGVIALATGGFLSDGYWFAVVLLAGPCAVWAIVCTGDDTELLLSDRPGTRQ